MSECIRIHASTLSCSYRCKVFTLQSFADTVHDLLDGGDLFFKGEGEGHGGVDTDGFSCMASIGYEALFDCTCNPCPRTPVSRNGCSDSCGNQVRKERVTLSWIRIHLGYAAFDVEASGLAAIACLCILQVRNSKCIEDTSHKAA